MATFYFEILGVPVAKGRPRVSSWGGHARVYTPTKTRIAENNMRAQIVAEMKKSAWKISDKPISMEVCFHMPRPKSLPKKYKHMTKKPDIDNLSKAFLDSANGVLFNDDSQVVDIHTMKFYGVVPKIVVMISEVD